MSVLRKRWFKRVALGALSVGIVVAPVCGRDGTRPGLPVASASFRICHAFD